MLMFATSLVFINVVLRFFGHGIAWAEEGTRYIIAWLTFVGGSLCAKHGEHVGIDLLIQFTPPIITKIIIIVSNLFASIFMFVMVYYGWLLSYSTIVTGQISTGIMMPMWIVYIGIPIGCFLMAIRFLQAMITALKTETYIFGIKESNEEVDISRL